MIFGTTGSGYSVSRELPEWLVRSGINIGDLLGLIEVFRCGLLDGDRIRFLQIFVLNHEYGAQKLLCNLFCCHAEQESLQ